MPAKLPIALITESSNPVVAETFERLKAGGGRPVNIHRSVAQSPEVFAKFVAFARSLRFETVLKPSERELAILRILEHARGEYELKHHRRMAATAGVSTEKIETVSRDVPDLKLFDAREAAILKFVDAFRAGHGVADDVQREMKSFFSDRQIVEIALTIALYFGLAHYTNALDVPID